MLPSSSGRDDDGDDQDKNGFEDDKFFWVLATCKLVGRYQRFEETHSPEEGDSTFLINVGIYRRVYTAPTPRRSSTSSTTTTEFRLIIVCAAL